MEITRTFDLLDRYQEKFLDKDDALAGKMNGNWIKYSSQDYINNSNYISLGLMSMGLKKGDKIAVISNNRPEWNFLDMGMAQIGVIHVPLFTTLQSFDYEYFMSHSEVKLLFVSDKKVLDKVKKLPVSIKQIKSIFSFDDIEGVESWKKVLELGKKNSSKIEELKKIKDSIKPNDFLTLIYTSGTTGISKGVMLSHTNLVSNSISIAGVFKLKPDQKYLSVLPACHVGERMAIYQTQYSGTSIYYAENLSTIARDLKDIKPHGFAAVPRILEKIFDKIISNGKQLTGVKKKLFFWAVKLGLRYELDGKNGVLYEIQLKLARKIIFNKWLEAVGGNVITIGVGGASLQPRLEKVFWAAGMKLLNMYGLTETSPVITINRQNSEDMMLGSVGCLIDNVEVKIAKDGEILCKGPNIMLGYYKNEKATAEVIDKNGWFHTGDVGEMVDGKFLRITDRKKELFKLSNGKFVSPQAIENSFKSSVFIDQLMVIGEGRKHTSALISPNFEELKEWCLENGIGFSSPEKTIAHEKVFEHYKSIVSKLNKSLNKDEQVKRFKLVEDEWTPDSGLLSPTLKLKRSEINKKYNQKISEIFDRN